MTDGSWIKMHSTLELSTPNAPVLRYLVETKLHRQTKPQHGDPVCVGCRPFLSRYGLFRQIGQLYLRQNGMSVYVVSTKLGPRNIACKGKYLKI